MLDDRVRAVLERLEREDADERVRGLSPRRALAPGHARDGSIPLRVRCTADGLRSVGDRRFARLLDDLARRRRPLSRWPRADAGLDGWVDLVEGDAFETLPAIDDVFDVVFLDAEKDDYERLFGLARPKLEPGAVVIADNVLSHAETLGAYSRARQDDRSLESVTVPLDRGLELSVVLR